MSKHDSTTIIPTPNATFPVGRIDLPPARRSWRCRRCGTVWAPHVDSCKGCEPQSYVVTYGAYEEPL